MAEEKCKKSKKVLDKYKSLCYNIKADWLNRSENMRECWNRQTGTFEVRVSLTCGFKSHLSHQTPFRFWAVFFYAYKAKAVRISEPFFRLYDAVERLQCAVWRRYAGYARGAFCQMEMRCRGQCPTDIRGWYVYGCENRLSFHIYLLEIACFGAAWKERFKAYGQYFRKLGDKGHVGAAQTRLP